MRLNELASLILYIAFTVIAAKWIIKSFSFIDEENNDE